jgi:hypothetical protein
MSEQPDPYGQPYPQPGTGQPGYGQPEYGQYAQPQYAAAPYGQQLAGHPPVPGSRPAKPGSVVTAAVLGFVWGAIGVLVTLGFVIAGVGGSSLVESFATTSDEAKAGARFVTGVAVFLALLALAWTVLMIWGGILALTGRSRVLLIVGGSLAIAATGLYFLVVLANASQVGAGGVTVTFLLLAVSILIVVLLCLRAAGRFFAAHRALRTR